MQTLLQDEAELTEFIELLKSEDVRSYLEIGAHYGGCLQRVGMALRPRAKLVAVNLQSDARPRPPSYISLEKCIGDMRRLGHEAHLVWGDSTDADVVSQVKKLGPFDVILVDANHTLAYVSKDWMNYGPMGRIVAFHDIAWRRAPEWKGIRIDVPQFWNGIKDQFRYREIKHCPTRKNNGIGVLWRC